MCAIEPPVASIGSRANTGRPASDSGSDSMYGIGWWVSSLRAMPTNPVWASGMSACAASTMPSPARTTGYRLANPPLLVPVLRATGVCSGAVASGASRVAS